MRIWLRSGGAIGLFCTLFVTAQAADIQSSAGANDFYVSASGGLSYPFDPEFDAVGVSGELDFENGWAAAGALGWMMDSYFRAELELAMRSNELDSIEIDGLGTLSASGETRVLSALAKVAYEFDLGILRPYAAAGLGIARYTIDLDAPSSGTDADTVLAGEFELGASVAVTEQVDLFTSAQLLILDNPNLDPTSTGSAELNHPTFLTGSAGLRFHF